MDKLWLYAAAFMLIALAPCMITVYRGKAADRLAALEMGSVIITLQMLLLAQGYHRSILYDLPLTLALLSFGGGMVFARFLERWL